jgi:hypothetical protein
MQSESAQPNHVEPRRKRFWRSGGLQFALWTVIGLVASSQAYSYYIFENTRFPAARVLLREMPVWYLWGLLISINHASLGCRAGRRSLRAAAISTVAVGPPTCRARFRTSIASETLWSAFNFLCGSMSARLKFNRSGSSKHTGQPER